MLPPLFAWTLTHPWQNSVPTLEEVLRHGCTWELLCLNGSSRPIEFEVRGLGTPCTQLLYKTIAGQLVPASVAFGPHGRYRPRGRL